MNRYYSWILFLLVIVSACCTDDSESLVCPKATKEAFHFTGNVVEVASVKTIYGFFESGDSIGIYMFNADSTLSSNSIFDNVNNYLYKSLSLSSNPEFVPVNADTIFYPTPGIPSFIAYSPGMAVVNNFLIPVDLSSQPSGTSLLDLDLLYSNNATKQTSLAINLVFKHTLSYLNIEVIAGSGLESAELEGCSIVFKNIGTKANFNLVNGAFQDIVSPSDSIVLPGKYYPANQADEFVGLIIPGSNNSNSQIVFRLTNNKQFIYEIPASQVFQGGYVYNYVFTLSSSSAVVSASIDSWQIGELPNNGVIEVQ